MSEEEPDHTKENALKTSLDFLDGFLADQTFFIGDFVTIADFSILSSITQLEAMGYKITSYRYTIFEKNILKYFHFKDIQRVLN